MDEPTTKLRAMKLEDTTKEDTIMDDPTKDDTDDTDDPNTQDPEGTEEAEKIEEEEEPLEIGGFLTLLHDHDYLTMTTPPFNPSNPITPPPTTSTSTSISNPKPPPPPTPPSSYNTTNVQARDLSPGHAILFQGRPVEITARTDRLMRSGPLASRHRVRFSLVELFDKEVVVVGMGEGKGEGLGVGKGEGKGKGEREEAGLDVKATEWLKRVGSERVRYSLVCMLVLVLVGCCCFYFIFSFLFTFFLSFVR